MLRGATRWRDVEKGDWHAGHRHGAAFAGSWPSALDIENPPAGTVMRPAFAPVLENATDFLTGSAPNRRDQLRKDSDNRYVLVNDP